ncbi:MAG: magnesium transporter [Gammaproteobacteria bacterium]|nr:MAG: magnesium transporter [Gammaproteobacteria bacterium]TND02950.1 MAG: magnesium transporter [Gammaproteobacteria bacterium]
MAATDESEKNQDRLGSCIAALHDGALESVRTMLEQMHPAEIAQLLESLSHDERQVVWEMVDPEVEGDVLAHVNDDVRASLIRGMEIAELVAAAGALDTDDLADLLSDLPDAAINEVLLSLDAQDRQRLEAVLSYPEDTAGGLMNVDTITVRPNVTLDVVLRYLRWRGELPDATDQLIVVDRDDHYLGLLPITTLLTKPPTLSVTEAMISDEPAIDANKPASEVAKLFEQRDLVSAPVVNDAGKLVGRITIDDVVDVIRDSADHSLLGLAGLDEHDDMFAPVMVTSRNRAGWLGINLLTALLASWVIGLFATTLDKIVVLAVLMPIVASMGGVAGSQTLTIVIRGIALGRVGSANARRLMAKEIAVGLLNGVLWALVVAGVTIFWFRDYQIGAILGVAIVINLVFAAFAGAVIPLLLRRFGADPALGGSVILTTITDVVGFMAFLGLATLFLL